MALYTKCSVCKKKIPRGTVCECRKESYKEYDKRIRYSEDNKKYAAFYNSKAWLKLSNHVKAKYNGMCLKCLLVHDNIIPCDVAHHIQPIRDDYSKRLEENNLIPLCHGCHNKIDHINYTEEDKEELRMLLVQYKKIYI